MKIMHICKKYPWALGGDAVVVANLQKQLQNSGHQTEIVTSNCDEIADGPNIYKIGLKDTPAELDKITVKRLLSLVILSFKMFGLLARNRPDVIHTHSVDMAFFVSFAAHYFGIPVVQTFHIVTFYDQNQSLLRRKSELWLAKKSKLHTITAPNIYDVNKLQEAGFRQATLLPNGIDISMWEINEPVKNDIFTFLAIGRLERQKGYEYLIKAAAILQKNNAQTFKIQIVGEGSQEDLLSSLVAILDLEDVVFFCGRKNQPEVHQLLAQSDAAVFPSLFETTPLTLLEAWAACTPVITTPVGIVRDAPPDFDAAYIIPIQNEFALAAAMEQCMKDSNLRTSLSKSGYKEAQKYAWPAVTKTAEAIYGKAAK